ncbi:hypothetical protein DRJ73_15200, partial [Enterococcus faecalis]
ACLPTTWATTPKQGRGRDLSIVAGVFANNVGNNAQAKKKREPGVVAGVFASNVGNNAQAA